MHFLPRQLCRPVRGLVLVAMGMSCFSARPRPSLHAQTSAATQVQSSSGAVDLEGLRRLIDRGGGSEALAQLAKLSAQTPVPAGVYRLEGQAYYALNQYPAADRVFAQAIAQDPKDIEAVQMRGLTLFRLGRPADAIPLLAQAQHWGPETRVDPSYVLALCYLDTRRYDDARHAFALQYGFAPDSARAYLLAARMLLRREFVPVAREYAHKALELDPQLPLAHLLLGEVALAENKYDEAVAEFTKEQERNPLEPGLYDRVGDAYTRAGRYQEASQWLQRAVLLEPSSTGPYILLGKVLLKQGSPANATMYLERAQAMDPGNYMTHSLLGQAYRALGRSAEAARQTDLSQKLQSGNEPRATGTPQAP